MLVQAWNNSFADGNNARIAEASLAWKRKRKSVCLARTLPKKRSARKCRRHRGRLLETVSPDLVSGETIVCVNYFFFFTAFLAAGFFAFLAGFLAITLFVFWFTDLRHV